MGEETITDINLVDIQARHPADIRTWKFTRAQEAANGADWEWNFIGGGLFITVRLQAKKLYPDGGYASLYGQAGRDQADDLIGNTSPGLAVPLYCFYNYIDAHACPFNSADIPQIGCAVASAYDVRNALYANSANLQHIAPLQMPWRNLVCGLSFGSQPGDGRAALESVRGRLVELLGDRQAAVPKLQPLEELPEYAAHVHGREPKTGLVEVPARRVTTFRLDRD